MIQRLEQPPRAELTSPLARDVAAGLIRTPKAIPSAHFYDARGSELFEQITTLPEYYLTACEREILTKHGRDVALRLPQTPYRLIELGAGDGHKTEILLEHLLDAGHEIEYWPIDICARSVEQLAAKVRSAMSSRLHVQGIVGDYFDALMHLRLAPPKPCVVLFLGSSIGNFTLGTARRFLRAVRELLRVGDQMLIGFDLKKDLDILQRAYDDSAGVTREFNLNLLDRINRELGGEFEREAFVHHATYNLRRDCMESWLVSRRAQRVRIADLGMTASFDAWEGMRLERSHKYDARLIHRLAADSRFGVERDFSDQRGYFIDSLWRAK